MIKIDSTSLVSSLADLERSSKGSKIIIGPNVRIDSLVSLKSAGVFIKR